MRFSRPIVATLGLLCLAGPAVAGPPEDLVRIFYNDVPDISAPELRRHFVDPALSVLARDEEMKQREGEMGCLDFIVQIDGQDFDPAVVDRTLAFEEVIEGDKATVTASFESFEGADAKQRIVWSLLESDGAWKVADIASPGGDWRLGEMACDP
jgi:hypothetical protein